MGAQSFKGAAPESKIWGPESDLPCALTTLVYTS